MSDQPTVADYIVRRLACEGITDCFGVAADYAVTPVTGPAPAPYPKPASGTDLAKAVAAIAERVEAAQSLAVLPAYTASRFKLQDKLRALVEALACPYAAMAFEKIGCC